METASTVLSGNEGTRELDVLSCIIEDVGSVVRLESTDPDPDPDPRLDPRFDPTHTHTRTRTGQCTV